MTLLAEKLGNPNRAPEPEFRPRVDFDGQTGVIVSEPHPVDQPVAFEDLLEKHDLAGKGVMLDRTRPVRVSRWQAFDGTWLQSDRFHVVTIDTTREAGDALLARIKAARKHRTARTTGPSAFTFQASDLQLGKSDNGGSEAILDRYYQALEGAVAEYKAIRKRHSVGTVHLTWPGDCVEGNQSQNGRNFWRTDLTITEQIDLLETIYYDTIEAFAPLTDDLIATAVNGNHDEAQRFQTTKPGDGWATRTIDAVRKGLARNTNAFGHVRILTPDPERGYLTTAVGDTVFVIAHGHQWRRNQGMKWWAEQAFHGQNPGGATILAHGHYHGFELETTKDRTRICSSTFDDGSNYYRELRGAEARRGGLTYITSAGQPTNITPV